MYVCKVKNVNIATRCLSAPLHIYIHFTTYYTFSHIHFPTYIFPHDYIFFFFYMHTFSPHVHFLHTFSHIHFLHIDTYIFPHYTFFHIHTLFLHTFPTYKCMYVTLGTYRRLYVAHTTLFSKMYVCMRHRPKKMMYVRHWLGPCVTRLRGADWSKISGRFLIGRKFFRWEIS